MNKLLSRAIAASMVLALSGVASADIVYINFDDAADGETIDDQYDGLHFGLVGTTGGPKAHAITKKKLIKKYDSAGGLVIRPSNSELGTFKGPWFDIEISFDLPTDFFSIRALDADEPVKALAYLGDELVDSISFKGGSNYQIRMLELGELGGGAFFDRVVLDIRDKGKGMKPGPEIFDNLSYNAASPRSTTTVIPTPGALTLLATSGLLATRRRRRED